MSGWIKLHRELTDKAIWQESTPEQKTILITLLMMANHQEKEWEWKGKRYRAEPGQFVTSLPSIVKKCGKGITIQNVRTALARFKKYEFLTDESTNKNRLITIINWGLYQAKDDEVNIQSNRLLTGNQQAANRQLTANKNDKNDKNDKNIKNKDIENIKHKFGEFNHVRLKEKESNKLIYELGKETFDKCIKKLDEYIQETGKKYKDHNLTIRRWVIKAVKEDAEKGKVQNNNKFINFEQREYDFEAIEKKAMEMVLEENKERD